MIRKIVADNEGRADFALMTFGSAVPPTNASEVPDPCVDLDTSQAKRFTWIENVNQPYSTQWKPASNSFGGQGFWLLCGDNKPFPYLRHDDLGAFSMPNESFEELVAAPLYTQKSTAAGYARAHLGAELLPGVKNPQRADALTEFRSFSLPCSFMAKRAPSSPAP